MAHNLCHKNESCDSAGGISEYFLLILTAGGCTVVQHWSDSTSLGFFSLWECFEVETLEASMRLGYLRFCNIKPTLSDGQEVVRGIGGSSCPQCKLVLQGRYPLLVWQQRTPCVFVAVLTVISGFKLNHNWTIPKVNSKNDFILRGSNLIWPWLLPSGTYGVLLRDLKQCCSSTDPV